LHFGEARPSLGHSNSFFLTLFQCPALAEVLFMSSGFLISFLDRLLSNFRYLSVDSCGNRLILPYLIPPSPPVLCSAFVTFATSSPPGALKRVLTGDLLGLGLLLFLNACSIASPRRTFPAHRMTENVFPSFTSLSPFFR